MNFKYDRDADILMFVLKEEPPVNAISEPGGGTVSYDEHGEPITH